MVDAIDNMLAHASFGAVFLTVWLMLGAATFAFSVLVGFLVRRPRPGHWLAPIGPGSVSYTHLTLPTICSV